MKEINPRDFDLSKFKEVATEIDSNNDIERLGLDNRWIAEDISEGDDEPLYSVFYYFKNPAGYWSAIYIISNEMSMTTKLVDPVPIYSIFVIPKNHPAHPYNAFGKTAVMGSMIKIIFEKEQIDIE